MNEFNKNILKTVVHSEDVWKALNSLKEEMLINWSQSSASAPDEFSYLRNNFERDGKILGLDAFFRELERMG